MDASRLFAFSLAVLLAGATSFAVAPTAQARVRVYVGTPDVVVESGQPYYRTDHSRLYVETYNGQPRYYRYSDEAIDSGPPAYGARANGEWNRHHHNRYYYRHHHRYYYRHHHRYYYHNR
jgi:hypothetical protein